MVDTCVFGMALSVLNTYVLMLQIIILCKMIANMEHRIDIDVIKNKKFHEVEEKNVFL